MTVILILILTLLLHIEAEDNTASFFKTLICSLQIDTVNGVMKAGLVPMHDEDQVNPYGQLGKSYLFIYLFLRDSIVLYYTDVY